MEDQEYDSVNSALNEYFFRGRFEMLPVYLDLEGDAEEQVAEALGVDADELCDFIGLTATRSLRFDKRDPYIDQAKWLLEWSLEGRRDPPPFTALLCALSIAAERMGTDENFSPNNYSERLFELLGVKDVTSQQKLRQYAKSTRQFWRALNMWLAENDFQLGRPTARAVIGHWKYASFGLSQALVRDADRKRLSGLFEKYDLVPGEPVPEAEMALLVHDWMSSHGATGPTPWLRKLWQSSDLRPRVVSAALDAFETWERTAGVAGTGPRKARLQWQVGFTGFPRKRARLSLAAFRGGEAEALEETGAGTETGDQLFLEDGLEQGTRFLGPVGSINLDMLLLKSRSFTGVSSGVNYGYIAKPIVTLARAPDGPVFREVSRVSLFEEHAILCHEAWLDKVEGHLSKCARPGHSVLRTTDMAGIPEGWCILRGVEVVRAVDNAHDNFHALSPIASAAALACVDGLKLGHGTWHVAAPPLVEATSEKPGTTIEIIREQFGKKDEVIAKENAVGDFMEASLDAFCVEAGTNLRAVVKHKSTELAETSFSLRSADIPRPLGAKSLSHGLLDTRFALDPLTAHDHEPARLEGCVPNGKLDDTSCHVAQREGYTPGEVPEGTLEEAIELEWCNSSDAAIVASESCVIRGYHYWVYEAFEKGDDRYDAKMAECKDCRVKALSRTREVAKGNAKKMAQHQVFTPARRSTKREVGTGQVSETDHAGVPVDTVLDGLCYLGHGSWPAFQRLATAVSPEPWFAHSLASDLFALGHIEMRGRLLANGGDWSVPPPALVIGMDGHGYLSGFQSGSLVDAVNSALSSRGTVHAPCEVSNQVTVHRWTGLGEMDLEALLETVEDAHGRKVTVTRNLASSIAPRLPSFAGVFGQAAPIHVEQADGLAMYDTRKARWRRVERMDGPGAYRVGLHGTRYVFRDRHGTTRQVGHQVAKTLAAQADGHWLHGYDMSTGRFTAALGVEPPWLFERALVVSGGTLPRRDGGRVIYERVEPRVGATILSKMYGKDEIIG
ncbi:hypothetical protein QEZ52_22755 (plasmid) [Aliisedimentitalea scapharcae]|uniref:Uncharacterized protein n=1 Tax=Aliisedimentitalea scapharcae TaxID=1524259 RepID=A0ABZ2XZN1_9RHOB